MVDTLYTGGVIAVKEKSLLGDKILRLTEMTAEEALRAVAESGFGGPDSGSKTAEELCRAEEKILDDFVREYAPSAAEAEYFLSPRDFHNAKAACKARLSLGDAGVMLAPDGLIPAQTVVKAVAEGDYQSLGKELGEAVREVSEAEDPQGAEIGAIFDKALTRHLHRVCRKNGTLKKMVSEKADKVNILTALRSDGVDTMKKMLMPCGTVDEKTLVKFHESRDAELFRRTPLFGFVEECLSAKDKGLPLTEAERMLDSFETEFFAAHKYDLEGKDTFLYYVFRRVGEIRNVRIILVCLGAGLASAEIRKRLRNAGGM